MMVGSRAVLKTPSVYKVQLMRKKWQLLCLAKRNTTLNSVSQLLEFHRKLLTIVLGSFHVLFLLGI